MYTPLLLLFGLVAICITTGIVQIAKLRLALKAKGLEYTFLKEIEGIKNTALENNYLARIENDIKLLKVKQAINIEDRDTKHKQIMEIK